MGIRGDAWRSVVVQHMQKWRVDVRQREDVVIAQIFSLCIFTPKEILQSHSEILPESLIIVIRTARDPMMAISGLESTMVKSGGR